MRYTSCDGQWKQCAEITSPCCTITSITIRDGRSSFPSSWALRSNNEVAMSFLELIGTVFLLGCAGATSADAQVADQVLAYLKALPAIDVESPNALYVAHQRYILPARFAFEGGHDEIRQLVLNRLEQAIDRAVPLG